MLRIIAILLLSLAASFATDEEPRGEKFQLRARVQDIVALSAFSGPVAPIGVDPRFAVTLKIESATPAHAHFAEGTTMTFAVHSPSRFFGTPDAKGRTYDFTLHREIAGGKTRVSDLEVRR